MTVYDCNSLACALTVNHTESEGKIRIFTGAANYKTYDNTALVADTWYNIINTWDEVDMSLYINGSQVTTALSTTGTLQDPTSGTFFIGANSGTVNYFNGNIEDVRIYDYVLSQGAVANIYNEGLGTYGQNPEASTFVESGGQIYDHSADTWNKIDDIAPLHHWKLNEYSGTTVANDSGTNPMPGSITADVLLSQTGYIDRCMGFTGTTGHIKVEGLGDSLSDTVTNFSCWLNLNGAQEGAAGRIFDAGTYRMFALSTSANTFQLAVSASDSLTVSDLSATTWFHVSLNKTSANEATIFLNGAETTNGTLANLTATGDFYLGNQAADDATLYGNLEDVRMYARALTQPEISAIYNNGKGAYDHGYRSGFPTVKDPIHHWKLQETTLSAAFEVSDSGSNAMTPATATSCLYGSSTGMANIPRGFGLTETTSVVDCGNLQELNSITAMSIVLWMKREDVTEFLFGAGVQGSVPRLAYPYFANDNLVFYMGSNVDSSGGYVENLSTNWQQIAYIYDGSGADNDARLKGYVNTEQQTLSWSGTIPDVTFSTTAHFFIGNGVLANEANGSISDVRLYNYVLSTEEVQNLYNLGNGTLL